MMLMVLLLFLLKRTPVKLESSVHSLKTKDTHASGVQTNTFNESSPTLRSYILSLLDLGGQAVSFRR